MEYDFSPFQSVYEINAIEKPLKWIRRIAELYSQSLSEVEIFRLLHISKSNN